MQPLVHALVFGVALVFILIGLVGIVLPILPGTLLIWLAVLSYAIIEGFEAIDWITFSFISIIALVTGTADLWLSILGSKKGGASWEAMLIGVVGGIVGFFLLGSLLPIIGNLIGGIVGYSLGVFVGQYAKLRDWNLALKATVGGLIGWGIATVIQIAGGFIMAIIFVWQVLTF